MSDFFVWLSIALGVLIAVLYPILYAYIRQKFPPPSAVHGVPPWLKKYAALFGFSLLTATIVLAVYRVQKPDTVITFWQALLMGFGWEASVEKVLVVKP